jgi:hypothetical protein
MSEQDVNDDISESRELLREEGHGNINVYNSDTNGFIKNERSSEKDNLKSI